MNFQTNTQHPTPNSHTFPPLSPLPLPPATSSPHRLAPPLLLLHVLLRRPHNSIQTQLARDVPHPSVLDDAHAEALVVGVRARKVAVREQLRGGVPADELEVFPLAHGSVVRWGFCSLAVLRRWLLGGVFA